MSANAFFINLWSHLVLIRKLRHTLPVIRGLLKGISTAYISKGFGHASFSTTEQYLGGFTQAQKKSVADLLTNLANE